MKQHSTEKILNQYGQHLQVDKLLSPASVKGYLGAARIFLLTCRTQGAALLLPDDWVWADLDKRAAETYLRHLEEVRHWKPGSIAFQLSALRALFRFLQARGLVERNPAVGLKAKGVIPPPAPIEGEEEAVRRLFAAPARSLASARVQLCMELLYGAGMRPSHVARIRQIQHRDQQDLIRVDIDGKHIDLPISTEGKARLQRYEKLRTELAMAGREVPFWVDDSGRAVSAERLARAVKKELARVDLQGGPSLLRKLAALHFRQRGGDLRSTQQLLGTRRVGGMERYAQVEYLEVWKRFKQSHPRGDEPQD